jgi:hypothetical protein
MLLDDDCHPIDSPNMRSILENVKFPNYAFGLTEMDFLLICKGISQNGGHHEPSFHRVQG